MVGVIFLEAKDEAASVFMIFLASPFAFSIQKIAGSNLTSKSNIQNLSSSTGKHHNRDSHNNKS